MTNSDEEYGTILKDFNNIMFVYKDTSRLFPIRIPAKYLKDSRQTASDGCYPANLADVQILNPSKLAKVLYE
jgi:hypothetical protein